MQVAGNLMESLCTSSSPETCSDHFQVTSYPAPAGSVYGPVAKSLRNWSEPQWVGSLGSWTFQSIRRH